MTPEGKQTLWIFGCIAALVVPMIAVPTLTFTLSHWRHSPSIDDPNPAVRVAALRATGWDGHVALLTRALQDEDADVRLVAAMYLPRRRGKAEPSVKALVALLRDKHEGVRREAAEALFTIGTTAAPALVSALSDTDPHVRAKAAWALRVVAYKDKGREVSPDELASIASSLEKMQRDEDDEVRRSAAETLNFVRRAQAGDKLWGK